jgi:hypothetical protein
VDWGRSSIENTARIMPTIFAAGGSTVENIEDSAATHITALLPPDQALRNFGIIYPILGGVTYQNIGFMRLPLASFQSNLAFEYPPNIQDSSLSFRSQEPLF